MELTLSSLELVNRLANAVELPKEFLTLYNYILNSSKIYK